ncbi:hypothetical protein ALC57_04157 [Trachymyrmex cornetzi]|uniref:Uncharacterized protein n=1 Tax=Trachymyrmex cornetzi TaxID=471704 RepID=A0A195EEK9_9HYME|nr:hypothetical protein ALC57_04157 [Trachymyrmex cornetzi]
MSLQRWPQYYVEGDRVGLWPKFYRAPTHGRKSVSSVSMLTSIVLQSKVTSFVALHSRLYIIAL